MVAKDKMIQLSFYPAIVMPSFSCVFKEVQDRVDLLGSKLHVHVVVYGT